ncbi:MAG: hypothetical protein BGO82_18785 [Devosia sp. 67-54]|nr:MAG: hypothetical protein BGO82_18785 [Devosia sp. 67-54]
MWVAALLLALWAPAAWAAARLPDVLDARVTTTPERARLIVDLTGTTEFAIASLDAPERIAIDIKAQTVAISSPGAVSGSGLVSAFDTVMAEDGRARTELTLAQPAVVQQAYVLDPIGGQPARLIVDLIPTSDADFKQRAAADLARAMGGADPDPASSEAPAAPASAASSSVAAVTPPPAAVAVPLRPSVPATGGSRPLIVLDPGHGGIDNGASAPNGIHEKDITLAFALQLRDLLVGTGLFDVAMTRDDDTYLTLNERVDLARQNKADLFISLHADTFQEADIRGASIYTRDARATDILDKVLADGENHADIVAGYLQPDTKPAAVEMLVDLMRRQVRQQSYLAAQDIVNAMQPSVALRRFPLRQADFFVLQAPDVPSMLIELGFMSNNADIANLENVDWRNKVVNAIAAGVQRYFKDIGSDLGAPLTAASGG